METNTELICEGHFSKTKASVSESVSGWILKFESWWLLYSLLSLWVFWSVGCTLCPIELSTARAGLAFVFHVDSSFGGSHSLSDLAWQPHCPLETSADMRVSLLASLRSGRCRDRRLHQEIFLVVSIWGCEQIQPIWSYHWQLGILEMVYFNRKSFIQDYGSRLRWGLLNILNCHIMTVLESSD